jgi:hypothetical protein
VERAPRLPPVRAKVLGAQTHDPHFSPTGPAGPGQASTADGVEPNRGRHSITSLALAQHRRWDREAEGHDQILRIMTLLVRPSTSVWPTESSPARSLVEGPPLPCELLVRRPDIRPVSQMARWAARRSPRDAKAPTRSVQER